MSSRGAARFNVCSCATVRGRITILDRRGLEAAVCECYRVVKDKYDRLLG
jgi:hypothetical protein